MGKEKDIKVLKILPLADELAVPHKSHKKRNRQPHENHTTCPFCKSELPLDIDSKEYKMSVKRRSLFYWRVPRLDCVCGAIKVKGCPACHRETFHKDGIYKHQKGWLGCGFTGPQRNSSSLDGVGLCRKHGDTQFKEEVVK